MLPGEEPYLRRIADASDIVYSTGRDLQHEVRQGTMASILAACKKLRAATKKLEVATSRWGKWKTTSCHHARTSDYARQGEPFVRCAICEKPRR